jgi:hypothetical protein
MLNLEFCWLAVNGTSGCSFKREYPERHAISTPSWSTKNVLKIDREKSNIDCIWPFRFVRYTLCEFMLKRDGPNLSPLMGLSSPGFLRISNLSVRGVRIN